MYTPFAVLGKYSVANFLKSAAFAALIGRGIFDIVEEVDVVDTWFLVEGNSAWHFWYIIGIPHPYLLRMLSLLYNTIHNFFPNAKIKPYNFAEL